MFQLFRHSYSYSVGETDFTLDDPSVYYTSTKNATVENKDQMLYLWADISICPQIQHV